MTQIYEKVGYGLFVLFALTVFISKAAINVSGSMLIVYTIGYCMFNKRRNVLKDHDYSRFLLIPLGVGLILSLFSYMGPKGAIAFMGRFRFFLMVIPFVIFIRKKRDINGLFIALNISGFIGIVYGVLSSDINNMLGANYKGLHVIGRNADLIFSLSLLNIIFLFKYKCENQTPWYAKAKVYISINTVLLITILAVIGERGPLLSFFIGLFLIAIFFHRWFLAVLIVLSIVIALLPDNWLMTRMKTISDVHHISNATRLQLYKTGADFIIENNLYLRGTGAKKAGQPFADFMKSKPKDYQNTYKYAMQHPGNFHNSFLQMAVEAGVLFLVLYLAGIVCLLIKMLLKMKCLVENDRVYIIAALIVTVSFFISQIFHGGLYRYPGVLFYIVFLGGCFFLSPDQSSGSQSEMNTV